MGHPSRAGVDEEWESLMTGSKPLCGTCTFWNSKKGYGFLQQTSSQTTMSEEGAQLQVKQDFFVHHSDLAIHGNFRSLTVGETVDFAVARHVRSGRLKAIDVQVCDCLDEKLCGELFGQQFSELFGFAA